MSVPGRKRLVAANDNHPPRKSLRAVVEIAPDLPVQIVEVEVIAQLLEALGDTAANDNEERQE